MKLNILRLSGESFCIDGEQYDTVDDIKNLIFAADGTPVVMQRLTLGDTLLDDRRTIASYGIQADATLTLARSATINLLAHMSGDAELPRLVGCQCSPGNTVLELKAQIEEIVGDLVDKRALELYIGRYGSPQLQNDRSLASYGLTHDADVRAWTVAPLPYNQTS